MSLRLCLLSATLFPIFSPISSAARPPELNDLLEFVLYWHQSDIGVDPSDYFAPELLCLIGGNCDLQPCDCDVVVTFTDPDFEAVIREILDRPEGDICQCDMARIKEIETILYSGQNPFCPGNIGNIGGIQYAVNLEKLSLGCGFVQDLSELAGLTKLKELVLHDHYVSDLTPLDQLDNLEVLDLFRNNTTLSDLSPLSGTTKLRVVNLSDNAITDLSPLSGNHGMMNLDLSENEIVDLASLAGMTAITVLDLSENQIQNLAPLSGMVQMDHLDLSTNQISDISPLAGMTGMVRLSVANNTIGSVTALTGMTDMEELFLANNQITDIDPLTDLVKVDTLTLSNNLIEDLSPLSDMTGLSVLDANNNRVTNLSPLATLVNLNQIYLSENLISSLETLPVLPQLEFLFLEDNLISDLASEYLQRIPALEALRLDGNALLDLSAIAALPSLKTLGIGRGEIDNSILATLPTHATLEELGISFNPITDLSPIPRLPNLKFFGARDCMISDLSPLTGMISLNTLSLAENQISNLTPIQGLVNLTGIFLDQNLVSDLGPIAGLTNLADLQLRANELTTLQPLIDNPNFGTAGTFIPLTGNPFTFQAQCEQIPILVARGASVTFQGGFDCSTPTPTTDPSLPTETPTPSNIPTPTFTQGADSLVWAEGVDASGDTSRAEDVATLPDGSSWVVGSFSGTAEFGAGEPNETVLTSLEGTSQPSSDIFLTRYNPDGSLMWVRGVGSSGNDMGFGVDVTADGNSFITGQSFGTLVFGAGETNETTLETFGGRDIFVAKYAADGSLVWAKRAGGESIFQWGNSVAALSDGGCVITGTFAETSKFGVGEAGETTLFAAGDRDLFLARYDSDGNLVWVRQAGKRDLASGYDIAVDESVGIMITGFFSDMATFGPGETSETTLASTGEGDNDIFVAKYLLDGSFVWAKRAGKGLHDRGEGIDLFPDGSSLVTGYIGMFSVFAPGEPEEVELESAGNEDVFLAKYDPDGTLVWVKIAGGPGDDGGTEVSILPDGSAFVAGYFDTSAVFGPSEAGETQLAASEASIDLFLAKYGSDGMLLWADSAGGGGIDRGWGVEIVAPKDAILVGEYRMDAVFGQGESAETTLPYTNTIGGSGIFAARYSPSP